MIYVVWLEHDHTIMTWQYEPGRSGHVRLYYDSFCMNIFICGWMIYICYQIRQRIYTVWSSSILFAVSKKLLLSSIHLLPLRYNYFHKVKFRRAQFLSDFIVDLWTLSYVATKTYSAARQSKCHLIQIQWLHFR